MRLVAAVCIMFALSACTVFVAERYRYSCSLGGRDLEGYATLFEAAFPTYVFNDYTDECSDGSARGVLFVLPKGAEGATPDQIAANGCTKYSGGEASDDRFYTCATSGKKYELIFEAEQVYLNPLAP
jgi:hypothetical protein